MYLSLAGIVSVTVTPGGTPRLRRAPRSPPPLGHNAGGSPVAALLVSRSESALAPAPTPRDDEDDVGCAPLVLALPVVPPPSMSASAPPLPPRLPVCRRRRGRASGGPCLRSCDRQHVILGGLFQEINVFSGFENARRSTYYTYIERTAKKHFPS